MGCSEIPAWLDIDVTVDGACGSLLVISHGWVRRRCNASHPSKRWSPKRFFISPKRIPLRYVTQMGGHGRNIFIPFRRSARGMTRSFLRLCSRALRKFIFYRIESAASRGALCTETVLTVGSRCDRSMKLSVARVRNFAVPFEHRIITTIFSRNVTPAFSIFDH